MQGRFVFLGTGASTGTPMIGCRCFVCTSKDSRNLRLRPSAIVEVGGKRLLIDVGPDFRSQALKFSITQFDGILLTHAHFDHIGGIDELRVLHFTSGRAKIPCLLSRETLQAIAKRCYYMMEVLEDGTVKCNYLEFHLLEGDFGSVVFEGIPFDVFSYEQLGMRVTGYRFGNLAYVPDMCAYSDEVLKALGGVEIMIVDALREEKSRGHFSLDEAIAFSKLVGAKKSYFTHIAHEMDLAKVKLPTNCEFAYDGLKLDFNI